MTTPWDGWIGREVRQADRLDPSLVRRWCATFDLPEPGDALMPQGIHLCLCTPEAATATLGEDGHPARGEAADSLLPPVPLPRRMWASSAMTFHRPIVVGDRMERLSRIASIVEKTGGTGTLVFVEIDHATHAAGALAVEERQTLVYRDAAAPDAPLSPPEPGTACFDPSAWEAHRRVVPDERLLFRYSALTFNTHRIHYDAPYACEVERYRGLVVHGPLTASLLLQLAAVRLGGGNRLARFAFRGLSPAIAGEPLHLVMRHAAEGLEMAAFADDGRQVTSAKAALR